jgi:hypothetical protein
VTARHRKSHFDPRLPLHLQVPQCPRQLELPAMIPLRKTPGRTGSLPPVLIPGLRKCGAPTTDPGAPGAACASGGRKDDEAGEGERSPWGPKGSPADLNNPEVDE